MILSIPENDLINQYKLNNDKFSNNKFMNSFNDEDEPWGNESYLPNDTNIDYIPPEYIFSSISSLNNQGCTYYDQIQNYYNTKLQNTKTLKGNINCINTINITF